MPFDIGSLSTELLDEMLEDHKTTLAPLRQYERWADIQDNAKLDSKVYKHVEPLELPDDGHRSSKVALGTAARRSQVSYGTVPYKITHEYKHEISMLDVAREQIETIDDVSNKMVLKSNLQVLADFNRDLAGMLKGNGSAGQYTDFTERSLTGNTWDAGTPGNPTPDIDAIVKALRGGNIVCSCGFDVAQVLSRNPYVVGSDAGSGREQAGFDVVRQYLLERGISEVFFDATVEQASEGHYGRSYGGIYDGVFAIFTRGNPLVARVKALTQYTYHDNSTHEDVYEARLIQTHKRAWAEHGYYIDALS